MIHYTAAELLIIALVKLTRVPVVGKLAARALAALEDRGVGTTGSA